MLTQELSTRALGAPTLDFALDFRSSGGFGLTMCWRFRGNEDRFIKWFLQRWGIVSSLYASHIGCWVVAIWALELLLGCAIHYMRQHACSHASVLCAAQVGIVEYPTREEMEYAIKRLDRSEFCNIFHRAQIRVERDYVRYCWHFDRCILLLC